MDDTQPIDRDSDDRASGSAPQFPVNLDTQGIWSGLQKNPFLGITLLSLDYRVLYANERIVKIVFGEDASPESFIGKPMGSFLPPLVSEERKKVFDHVVNTGKPMLCRSVWQGKQTYAWVYPLSEAQGSEASTEVNHLVILTHASTEDVQSVVEQSEGVDVYQMQHVDLGEIGQLTPAEIVVLALLKKGLKLQEIAEHLSRSVKTVETHRLSIGRKLHRGKGTELIKLAIEMGLTEEDAKRHHTGQMEYPGNTDAPADTPSTD